MVRMLGPRRRCRSRRRGRGCDQTGGPRRRVSALQPIGGPVDGCRDGRAALGPDGHADGESRADEDVLAPCVGPLVQARDRRATLIRQPHVDGGDERTRHGDAEDGPEPPVRAEAPSETQQQQGHRWPDDVELLFDRERPHVLERRRQGGEVEIVAAAEDEVPVGHVEQAGQRVEPKIGELARAGEHLGVDGHPQQHDQQSGQQPAGPPGPELSQSDGEASAPLADEQRRDEETGQDEKHVDTEGAPAGEGRTPVVEHDPHDGHGAHPVERRNEPEAHGPAPPVSGERHVGRPGGRSARTHRGLGPPLRPRATAVQSRPSGDGDRSLSQIREARRQPHFEAPPPAGANHPARWPSSRAESAGRTGVCGQLVGVYPAGRVIVFFSRNSSRPSSPNSRPTPDDL